MSYGRAAVLVGAFGTVAYGGVLATWAFWPSEGATAAGIVVTILFTPFLIPLVALVAWACYRALESSLDRRDASEAERRMACMVLGAVLGPALVVPFFLAYWSGWSPPNAGYPGAVALAFLIGLGSGALIHRLAAS